MKKILGISGSIKPNSSNYRILNTIGKELEGHAQLEIYTGLTQLPYFEPGVADDQLADSVKDFLQRIEAADAVLIATPEYVFSIPGILKNALEWTVASTLFSDKAVGIIVSASLGDEALALLDLILSTLVQAPVPPERMLLIQSPARYFDNDGNLTDEEIKAKIVALASDLIR